jgi:peptidoglycan hydrolase-like protein with peptidoglycan-binding domain
MSGSPIALPPDRRRQVALGIVAAIVLGAAAIGAVVTAGPSGTSAEAGSDQAGSDQAGDEAAGDATVDTNPTVEVIQVGAELPDLEGDLGQNAAEPDSSIEPNRADGGCTIGALSVRYGSTGDGVACLQDALRAEGFFDGASDGQFGDSTVAAVRAYQTANDLFVDGVVGRESAIELGIWPDEESLVVHTPKPAPGAVDLWGMALSPVASAGDDAPPLPPNSGSGRRVVYDRAGQRAWAVAEDGRIIRSWLVAGSKYSNEQPGEHTVYSRSEMSTAWNGQAWLPMMIRYQKTAIGNIGFHGIPVHVKDNTPYMTTDQLGTRLSGGCQRQHNLDAQFMWAFATIGTTVVVT